MTYWKTDKDRKTETNKYICSCGKQTTEEEHIKTTCLPLKHGQNTFIIKVLISNAP